MKRTYLQIGEIAQLLGITQKAIRHYQKIGLLREPERSESGYRLYTAQDVLRLQRIRRLQALGLSLKQVKVVLGDVSHEQTLRDVLLALDEELSGQIQVLERRQARVRELLAAETLESVTTNPDDSPNLLRIKDYLAQQNVIISSELMAQEARMYAYLEDFHWGEDHEQAMQDMMAQLFQHMSEYPGEYQQLLVLGERLVAVASLSADAPEVEQLAHDFRNYFTTYPYFFGMSKRFPSIPNPFNAIFSELMMSAYSSAQQRVFEGIKHLFEENDT